MVLFSGFRAGFHQTPRSVKVVQTGHLRVELSLRAFSLRALGRLHLQKNSHFLLGLDKVKTGTLSTASD